MKSKPSMVFKFFCVIAIWTVVMAIQDMISWREVLIYYAAGFLWALEKNDIGN